MMRYTCQACVTGQHDLCAGRQEPPRGMIGGSECDCDGNCAERAAERLADRMAEFARLLWGTLDRQAARADLRAEGL